MSKGEVIFWNAEKAWGFATNEDHRFAPKVFMHISKFKERVDTDAILPGLRIEFETEMGRNAGQLAAKNIRILSDRNTITTIGGHDDC